MRKTRRKIPHLFNRWDEIAGKIQTCKRLALLIDFDGTLVRIAPLPGSVRLGIKTRRALRNLSGCRNATVVVISGRRRAELIRHVAIPGVKYLGLYGWERERPKKMPPAELLDLSRARSQIFVKLRECPGVWIEPKEFSFSIHLQGASPKTQRVARRLVKKALNPFHDSLRVMNNLRDIEVAPLSIGDKGFAVQSILAEAALRGALPIYFGDDISDEPAFAAVSRGISVLVGKRRATNAKLFLHGPEEVAAALSKIEEQLRERC